MNYVPSQLTCPGSLVWAGEVYSLNETETGADCQFCGQSLALEPGDRSGTLPAHDATDDMLPLDVDDLEVFIAEASEDVEARSEDPALVGTARTPLKLALLAERDVRNHALARLISLYEARRGCVDPDHGVGDHPCDEVLGKDKAAAARAYAQSEDDDFERAREFDRTHPGYWEYRP